MRLSYELADATEDWIRNVIITDPSRRTEHNGEDTVITLFRKTRQELEGFQTGCPVLFRGAKVGVSAGLSDIRSRTFT